MRKYPYILFLLLIFSCKDSSIESHSAKVDSTSLDSSNNNLEGLTKLESTRDVYENLDQHTDTLTTINFEEFTVVLSRFSAWDEYKGLANKQGDTCYIECEVGDSFRGENISITSNQITALKIEQCFETSVSISNEGPHCDLTNWLHFQSQWIALKAIDESTFKSIDYSEKEMKQFPPVDINELKEAVLNQCGNDWYQLVKDISNPNEYPSWIGLSRIYLRITGKINGKPIEKIIAINEQMGC